MPLPWLLRASWCVSLRVMRKLTCQSLGSFRPRNAALPLLRPTIYPSLPRSPVWGVHIRLSHRGHEFRQLLFPAYP
jgi:hypothetical protein